MIRISDEVLNGTIQETEQIHGELSGSESLVGTVSVAESITGTIQSDQGIAGTVSEAETINGSLTIPQVVLGDVYQGSYSFTPADHSITIPTALKSLEQNITIAPIPSNYGLITWDGHKLRIS